MLEQILIESPELRIVVLEKIEQSSGRPPKYIVDFDGDVILMSELTLNGWRSIRDLFRRDSQHNPPRTLTDV
jgi:hypothetical protein